MNTRRQRTYRRPQEVEVEIEDLESKTRWGVRFMRALAFLLFHVCLGIERAVRIGVRVTAFITVRVIYVLLPVCALVGVIAGVSHTYMEIEERVMSEAHAAYIGTVDYLASRHGYSVMFDTPIQEILPEEYTHENVLRLVRREMVVNGIPEGYEAVILAMLYHESAKGDPYAISRAGAKGVAQIMDATAKQLGFEPAEMFNLEKGIIAGVRWFRMMLDSQRWDLVMALKEYNAGEKRIDMTEENRRYPSRVLAALKYAYDADAWVGLNKHVKK